MHIEHHFPQKALVASSLPNHQLLKDEAITQLSTKQNTDLRYLSTQCLAVFTYNAYLNDDENNNALRDYVEIQMANLASSLQPGKIISYTFRNSVYNDTPEVQSIPTSPHLWNMLFFAALLLNNEQHLQALCAIDINQFQSLKKKKDYSYSMAVALKAFYLKEENYPELLSEALAINMKTDKKDLNYDKAMDIDGPALELLYLLLTDQQNEFNERLLLALKWHKKYHAKLEKKRVVDYSGMISIPLCALVVLAKKMRNFKVEHTSDYLPGYLVEVVV